MFKQVFQPLLNQGKVEYSLFVFKLERQMGRDGVGQTARVIDTGNRCQDLGRDLLIQFDVLVKLLHHRTAQCLNLARLAIIVPRHLCNGQDAGYKVRLLVSNALYLRTLLPLDQHLHRAVWQLEHLQDRRHTAHVEHIGGRRLVLGSSLLGHQHDAPVSFHGEFQGLDALGAPHK